jgi:uncharacterized protein (DUF58 family)
MTAWRPPGTSQPGPAARTATVSALSTLGALRRVVVVRTRGVGRIAKPFMSSSTHLGWTVLAIALTSWLAGALLGWKELLLLATTMLLCLALAVPFVLGRPGVNIRLDLDPPRVTAGDPAAGRLHFTNRSGRRSSPLDIDLPVGRAMATFHVPALAPGEEEEEIFILPTERRGVIAVGPPVGVKSDPLGLLSRRVAGGNSAELLVHPRTVGLPPFGTGLLRDLEGLATRDISNSDLAFHGLRDYVTGDDLRYVHWRSSAKAGRMQMRQFNDTRRSSISILVDSLPAGYGHPDEFETALEVAGSLALRAARDRLPALLMGGGQAATSVAPHVLLDALARAELLPAGPDLPSLAHLAATRAVDTTTAVIITGSASGPEVAQRAATRFPPEVRILAVMVRPGGSAGLRAGGRVTVIELPVVSDLAALVSAGGMV